MIEETQKCCDIVCLTNVVKSNATLAYNITFINTHLDSMIVKEKLPFSLVYLPIKINDMEKLACLDTGCSTPYNFSVLTWKRE